MIQIQSEINAADFKEFGYELEQAILATTTRESTECIARAKIIYYFLSRNLDQKYIKMLDDLYHNTYSSLKTRRKKNERLRMFRNEFSRLSRIFRI